MYDDNEHVDTFRSDINAMVGIVNECVIVVNADVVRTIEVVTVIKDNRYSYIDIVDSVYNDVVICNIFTTTKNKTTDKFIIPLDTMLTKEKVMNKILNAMESVDYRMAIQQKGK